MEITKGVHIVIVSSVSVLSLVTFNTSEGTRYGLVTESYDHYKTLRDQQDAHPNFEPGVVIMMDYDNKSIQSPFFTTEDQAFEWGLKNFPHLTKVGLADEKGHVWGYRLLSPTAINRYWLSYAGGGRDRDYPMVEKPSWVEPLRAANADPVSGKFLR